MTRVFEAAVRFGRAQAELSGLQLDHSWSLVEFVLVSLVYLLLFVSEWGQMWLMLDGGNSLAVCKCSPVSDEFPLDST